MSRVTTTPQKETSIDELLNSLPISWFYYGLILTVGLVLVGVSADLNLFQYISACAGAEFALSEEQRASLASYILIGQLAGSPFFSAVADAHGRRIASLWGCGIITAFSLLSGTVETYESLLVYRLFLGFGIGVTNIPFQVLLEFLPASRRGRVLASMRFFWSVGSLLTASAAYLLLFKAGLNWRLLVLVCTLPIAAAGTFLYVCLPESPRWLLKRGRYLEAADALHAAAIANATPFRVFRLGADTAATSSSTALPMAPARRIKRSAEPSETTRLLTGSGSGSGSGDIFEAAGESCDNGFNSEGEGEGEGEGGDLRGGGGQVWAFAETFPRYVRLFLPQHRADTIRLASMWLVKGCLNYGCVFLLARINSSISSSSGECSFDYTAVFWAAFVELASACVTTSIIDCIGRPKTVLVFLFCAMVGLFGLLVADASMQALHTASESLLPASLSGASTALLIASQEFYSTDLRATADAFFFLVSRIGAIASAYIVADFSLQSVEVFFICLCGVQVWLAWDLRETNGTKIE